MDDFETYLSPFTWRYGSAEMRRLWSEACKRRAWRQIWVALAEVQAELGVIRPEQAADLRAHVDEVDVPAALAIEAEIRHDLMAELKLFASQCPVGGGVLHLGATSTDIEDNADVLRQRQALDVILERLRGLLLLLADRIQAWADAPLLGFTHLQPAEPTTLGYRLSQYAQELLMDWEELQERRGRLRGKGFKGAVGTGASYAQLIGADNLADFETRLSARLGLPFFPVATQVYPRKQDYQLVSALAGVGGSLHKFAFDLRILQSPPIGELAEPFEKKQVGSSAMPFKRNPIEAEKIDSLARMIAGLPRLAWDNAAGSLLERTLDDSANRRFLMAEAFLIADELLLTAGRIVEGLQVNEAAMARNLHAYAPFAATERVLMALVKAGADRQAMHERLRQHALAAWQAVQEGRPNPMAGLLGGDARLREYLPKEELSGLLEVGAHLGDSPERARALAGRIRERLAA